MQTSLQLQRQKQRLAQAEQRGNPKNLLEMRSSDRSTLARLYMLPYIMEVAAKVQVLALLLFVIACPCPAPYINASGDVKAERCSVFGLVAHNFGLITGAEAATQGAQHSSVLKVKRGGDASPALTDFNPFGSSPRKMFEPDPLLVDAAVEEALGILEQQPNDVTTAVNAGRPCCLKRPFELSFLPYAKMALERLGLGKSRVDGKKTTHESSRLHERAGLDQTRKASAWLDIYPEDVLVALLPKVRRRHWIYTSTGESDGTEKFDRFAALNVVLSDTPYLSDIDETGILSQEAKVGQTSGNAENAELERISAALIFLFLFFSIIGTISAILRIYSNAYLKFPMWTDSHVDRMTSSRRRSRVSNDDVERNSVTDAATNQSRVDNFQQSLTGDIQQTQLAPNVGQTIPENDLKVVLFSSLRDRRRRPIPVKDGTNVGSRDKVDGRQDMLMRNEKEISLADAPSHQWIAAAAPLANDTASAV